MPDLRWLALVIVCVEEALRLIQQHRKPASLVLPNPFALLLTAMLWWA